MVKKITLIILIIFVMLFSNIIITFAATKSELKQQQSDIDEKIKETENKITEVENQLSDTMTEIQELTTKISEYQSQIDGLEAELTELEKTIAETEVKLQEAEKAFSEQEEMLKNRLVALYEAGETTYLDVLLSSSSIGEFLSSYYLISEITTYDTELLDQMEFAKNEIAIAKENLETSKQQVETVKANKEATANSLKTTQSTKEGYVAKLNEDEKALQAELDQFEEDKRAIERELASLAASSTITGSVITGNPSSSGYIRPLQGYSITCGWYGYSGHTGVDFSGSGISGKPVYAVKSGTIVTSTALKYADGRYRSYGEYVVIDHHDGTMTLYAHGYPGSRIVSKGQSVSQGQQIMSVGTTGNSTGPHLHFEVRINGRPVNPTPYLP